ncbi:MAG: prephenate dehydrogenase/arogenate dehydrogenase family protein [Candidatus Gracilibacteria bacterium]|nr:prephenate dehydrogenase/arogenate dehydrogenase family protein [Candidatus Gracilibacteria bacterium]
MNTPTISIIGGEGKMGKAFADLFEARGIDVLVADLNTKLTPEQAAKKGDIVIFSVPISKTVAVIKELAPSVKKSSLVADITSIKCPAIEAMIQHAPESCEVHGFHPMSGPGGITDLKKTVVVSCPVRSGKWSEWMLKFFTEEEAIIKETTAEEHDKMMSIVQGITHISSIATAMALKELGINVEDTLEFSSPVYKLRLDMIGRVLSQSPQLYAEIAVENPLNKKTITAYHDALKKLLKCIQKKDESSFIQSFEQAADHLGDFKEEAYQKTSELIQRSKDLL